MAKRTKPELYVVRPSTSAATYFVGSDAQEGLTGFYAFESWSAAEEWLCSTATIYRLVPVTRKPKPKTKPKRKVK